MPTSGKNAGSYFEACNCDLACPCVFLSPPTSGNCTVLLAWHIDQGRFGEVNLDGLNAVLAAHSPGPMLEVKWKVARRFQMLSGTIAKPRFSTAEPY